MSYVYFISHPEVIIEPNTPVPERDLSNKGKERVRLLLTKPWTKSIGKIYTSTEKKATTTAKMIARNLKLKEYFLKDLTEIDRSSTGYIEKKEFETVVNKFFQNPETSTREWEKAIDAQLRINKAVEKIVSDKTTQADIGIISHGGVGALLLSYLKHKQISRIEDQPGEGGGNYFVFTKLMELIHSWKPID